MQEQGERGASALEPQCCLLAFKLLALVIGLNEPRSHEILLFACLQEMPNNVVAPQKLHFVKSSEYHCKNTFLVVLTVLFTCNTEHI